MRVNEMRVHEKTAIRLSQMNFEDLVVARNRAYQ